MLHRLSQCFVAMTRLWPCLVLASVCGRVSHPRRGRYYHVVLWLSGRVRYIVEAYLLACQNVAWIDTDVEGEEEVGEAEDQLEVHRVACQSLYPTYASSVQIAASAEPLLSSSLGVLDFALEMVTESEVVFLRDADQFFLELLNDRAIGELDRVLTMFP